MVTGVAAGTCTIAANQAGSGSYSAAPQVTQNISVVSPTYTLTVNTSGASGVAINATPTTYAGTSNYSKTGIAAGTSITLSAPPTTGYALFTRWSGCTSTSGVSCTVTMNAAQTVTANYGNLLSQTITFGAAPSVGVSNTATVSATASSGLPVTFTSLSPGICSVSNRTVFGVAAGTCTLAANQAGNATYSPAQATQSFSITGVPPGPPTITSITAGSGSATIHFSPPSNTGGSTIANYSATCTASGQTTRKASGTASPITVKNMTGGVVYQCTLTATHSDGGTSAASAPLPVTPAPGRKSDMTPLLMLLLD
jgi:hypothetical protein